jgi:hypothetical protein
MFIFTYLKDYGTHNKPTDMGQSCSCDIITLFTNLNEDSAHDDGQGGRDEESS